MHCDNGNHFRGEFQTLLQRWGVQQGWSAPYYPQSHGKVERFNRMVKERLRRQPQTAWDRQLAGTTFAINSRVSPQLPHSSLELLCGVRPRGPMEVSIANEIAQQWFETGSGGVEEDVHEARWNRMQKLREERVDQVAKRGEQWKREGTVKVKVGDQVLVWRERKQGTLEPNWKGPASVTWVGDDGAVAVKFPGGRATHVLAGHKVKIYRGLEGATQTLKRGREDDGTSAHQETKKAKE